MARLQIESPAKRISRTLLPMRPAETIKIEQKGSSLRCRLDNRLEEEYFWVRNETTGKSVLKWEGETLLFDTLDGGELSRTACTFACILQLALIIDKCVESVRETPRWLFGGACCPARRH